MTNVNKGIHAHYVNLKDNVPFIRVYKTEKVFKSAYARMKDAVLQEAIDFNRLVLIKPEDLN
jgi:hypothetical protein